MKADPSPSTVGDAAPSSISHKRNDNKLIAIAPWPSMLQGSPKEQEAFAFFQERTNLQLSGFYACDFWNRAILQAAQQDNGIRHAIVALASVHRAFEETGEAGTDAFALQQYQLAIGKHLKDLSDDKSYKDVKSLESYLASSMLFICIEMLQLHFESTLALLRGAVKMLDESIKSRRRGKHALHFSCLPRTVLLITFADSAYPIHALEALLGRLQGQTIGLMGREALGTTIPSHVKPLSSPPMPDSFSSLAEARNVLDYFAYTAAVTTPIDQAHGLIETVEISAEYMSFHQYQFDSWCSAFDNLLASLDEDSLSLRDQQALTVLKIRKTMCSLVMNVPFKMKFNFDDQLMWDDYTAVFDDIVTMAELVVSRQKIGSSTQIFTWDYGIIASVYEIALLCRDPHIRRRAVSLLRDNPMKEGIWDSQIAGRAAELAVHMEESGAPGPVKMAADVPRSARMANMFTTWKSESRKAYVVFSKKYVRDVKDVPVDGRCSGWISW